MDDWSTLYRSAQKEPGATDDYCRKFADSCLKVKMMCAAEKQKRIDQRPKIIPLRACIPLTKGACAQCEATLMNGLKCSSKAKFGAYCGRHKISL
jgi:hypothetical protein